MHIKKNINDIRESPALKIIEKLFQKKTRISYHDYYIPKLNINFKNKVLKYKSEKITKKNLNKVDIVCLVTDHDTIDYDFIRKNSRIIVDCRGKFKKYKNILKA